MRVQRVSLCADLTQLNVASMKHFLGHYLLLTGTDAFGVGLALPGQCSLGCFTQTPRQHLSRSGCSDVQINVMRPNRGASTTRACGMTVDPGMGCNSRIRGDPAALERWFCSVGGTLDAVVLEETPRSGWGLRAERDLEVGETLAVIPRSMCLGLAQPEGESERDARKDVAWTGPPCLQALVEQVPEEFPDVRLGLVVLHERFKVGSKWEPYIQNLPSAIRGVPLSSFGAVEMRALQDKRLEENIDERCTFLLRFVKDVLDPLSPGPDAPFGEQRVGFGDLAWATAVASSRAFTHLHGGWRQETRPILVPFMDMLNFNFEKSNVKVMSAWPSGDEDEEEGEEMPDRPEIRLVTTRPVAAGESLEIRENYSNAERLRKYGFVDVDKRNECHTFTFEKKVLKAARIVSGILDEPFGAQFEADALEPWQQRVLVELRLDGPRADLSVHLGGDSTRGRLPVDDRLLAALRVLFARSKHELEGKTAKQLGRYKTGKLSVHVEQRVLAVVLGLSVIHAQQWLTTIEQDEIILYGRQVSPALEEALRSPPPWQTIAEEDVTLQDMLIENYLAGSQHEEEEEEEEEDDDDDEDDHHHDEESNEEAEEGDGQEEDEKEDNGEEEEECDEEETAVEEEEEEKKEEEAGGLLEIDPKLTWEMAQAVGYRLAHKRTLMDVRLLALAELRKTGVPETMMENIRPNVGPLIE